MRRILSFFCLIIISGALYGCAAGEKESREETADCASKTIFAMDTVMTLEAYGENAAEAVELAADEIYRIEDELSAEDENSDIFFLNRDKEAEVGEDAFYLIDYSRKISDATDGCFDITVYPTVKLWGFIDDNYRVPTDDEIKKALDASGCEKIIAEKGPDGGGIVKLGENMEITLGAIAKGYTSDRVMEIFKESGVGHAGVSLGGNTQVLGTRTDGQKWNIGIRDPEDTGDILGSVKVSDRAVITSGAYERYFEENGKRYGHIIDPGTGYPAESGILSVSIVSGSGVLADALSTSLFIMGTERAEEFWRNSAYDFDFIIEDESGTVYVTEGIYDDFSSDKEVVKVTKQRI
ncbi:MAG: FAD:protein FMN transferase [Lachnospiraceae bacterium]|jgi:thiamine biosynthesis lipoprotein